MVTDQHIGVFVAGWARFICEADTQLFIQKQHPNPYQNDVKQRGRMADPLSLKFLSKRWLMFHNDSPQNKK
jgi:hypothetical protein